MTTEEFEKVAGWLGWHEEETPLHGEWWLDGQGRWRKPADSTSLIDAEAVEALNRLVEKDLSVSISGGPLGWTIAIVDRDYHDTCASAPTIASAVEQALLQIAAKEG